MGMEAATEITLAKAQLMRWATESVTALTYVLVRVRVRLDRRRCGIFPISLHKDE